MDFKSLYIRFVFFICTVLYIDAAAMAQPTNKPAASKPATAAPSTKLGSGPAASKTSATTVSPKTGSGTVAPASSKSGPGMAAPSASKTSATTVSPIPGSGAVRPAASAKSASSKETSPNAGAKAQPEAVSFLSSWGPIVSGSAMAAQVASIAPAAILVKDNNGKLYEVYSFRINYKFKSSYKDEEAGSSKTMNDLRVSEFSSTAQLPDYWVSSIRDNIKAGDEIIFNKILFRNISGKLQLAPELRIIVQ